MSAGAAGPALPTRWPSAWPSLRKQALIGSIFPIAVCVVAVIVLTLTTVLTESWWIAALPLLLLIWPLSLPSRARSVIQKASDRQRLQLTAAQSGLIAQAPRKKFGVRPNVTVKNGADVAYVVRYYLN